jgi:uncharacterized protein (DUF488 family)
VENCLNVPYNNSVPQANRLSLPSAPVKQQIRRKLTWNEARSSERADFFTIGYTGRKTEEIVTLLTQHEIQTLVDIRKNPVSMYRPELSKNNLAKLLNRNGLSYVHAPQFGVPRDIRAKAKETGTRDVIWNWYDENVLNCYLDLHFFFNGYEHPVAFMCTEIDPQECHRHRLSLALEAMGLTSFDL